VTACPNREGLTLEASAVAELILLTVMAAAAVLLSRSERPLGGVRVTVLERI